MMEAFPNTSIPQLADIVQSPGLGAGCGLGPAFELKFQLPASEAPVIESWARQHLLPDPHGRQGAYHITSVYFDTPHLDVFHRSPGYRRRKYRLRRYDDTPLIYLERKTRRGDRVKKKRVSIPEAELPLLAGQPTPPDWAGNWFLERLNKRSLQPVCRVEYRRLAFLGSASDLPIRLTMDQQMIGVPCREWDTTARHEGAPLLPEGVLVELKFHTHLPELFRNLLPQLPIQQARVSKYRRCVQLCGLAGPAPDPEENA